MEFEREDKKDMDQGGGPDWTDESSVRWTKEQSKGDRSFDFAAFLGQESLEEKIAGAMDGKDLMENNVFGEYAPDYIPRRAASGERGRHEAPGSGPDEEDDGEDGPAQTDGEPRFVNYGDGESHPARQNVRREEPMSQRPHRNDPPPRPKVVVAEPAKRVYITPPRPEPRGQEPPHSGGMKALVVLVAVVAVIVAVTAAIVLLPGGGEPEATPSPSPTDYLAGLLRPESTEQAPAPAPEDVTPAPTDTPLPAVRYSITVTAGSGGSVSPAGTVDVVEGGSISFSITPDAGYELGELLVDGGSLGPQGSYTFSNVTQNHTLYAVFRQIVVTPEPTQEPTPTPAPTQEPTPTPEPTLEPADPPAPEE